MPERVKVLIVGQTPPPYHGQAIMIERLLRGKFARVELFHVRMAFSDSIAEVGRFRIGKLIHLMAVVARIVYCRCVHRPTVLCYPPAGPNPVPVYRDLAILLCTRWMFRRTILYFHAGGISQLYPQFSPLVQWLFRKALFGADAAIRISHGSPNDAQALQARRAYVLPYGIEDEFAPFSVQKAFRHGQQRNVVRVIQASSGSEFRSLENAGDGIKSSGTTMLDEHDSAQTPPLKILFVGILSESKGLLVLIEACALLAKRGVPFELNVAGQFVSADFEQEARVRIGKLKLNSVIRFLGVLTGDVKWKTFAGADVLCLPTFYEAETFGLVLVEAMSFALPVVATRWRGIPEIVDDGVTGFLVKVQDAAAVADSLEQLQAEADLRNALGDAGREKYLREFTAERYWERMEKIFIETAESSGY